MENYAGYSVQESEAGKEWTTDNGYYVHGTNDNNCECAMQAQPGTNWRESSSHLQYQDVWEDKKWMMQAENVQKHDPSTYTHHDASLPRRNAEPSSSRPSELSKRRRRRRVISSEQRRAANIRERKRMFQLNQAFSVLRRRVPTFAYEKKLSRIETLRLAVTYIEFMSELLGKDKENREDGCQSEVKIINDIPTDEEPHDHSDVEDQREPPPREIITPKASS